MRVDVSKAAWTEDTPQGWEPAKGRNVVFFYEREIKNNVKTIEAGRPIFDTVPYLKIIIPGDKNLEIDRKATDKDKLKYLAEWDHFKKKQDVPLQGTPLEAWPLLDRRQVAEFKAMNIFTVDQLTDLPDSYGAKMMGFQGIKQKAKNFLEAAKDSSLLDKTKEELGKRDALLAEQGALLKQMQERMAELEANQKKKPGRKPGGVDSSTDS